MPDAEDEPAPGDSTGKPAQGRFDLPHEGVMGGPGMRHWRQSTITEPGLGARGNIFFAAVEMTRMPMILTDPNLDDNPIAFANNAFLDLTGYEEEEVLGRNCRFLQGAATDRETVRELRDAVARREAVAAEILNYRRDGSPFWNAVFIGPVFDPDGKLLYFFASQLDVSRRRESDQAMRQAQKMEAIGQLTAGLAHDFNNLLHVVSGGLERMAARRDDEATFRRYHAAASTAAERGAKLTAQLLAFARRSRLEPKTTELSQLVTSVAELLDSTAGSRTDLRLNLRRRLPEIRIDPMHLEMALINIVINARDAMPEGGVVTVATERRAITDGEAAKRRLEPGEYVTLEVQDEGRGMAPHVLARATEPFFTTKAPGEGTGLGLAMAHGFAQQSGGRLEIESAEGRGTTVRILFPVLPPPPQEEPAAAPRFRPREMSATAAPLVLVVEDSPEIADMAVDALSEIGYRVIVASDAETALKLFDQSRETGGVDLVFSDVVMPGGRNGLMLAEDIRARAPDVPILLTTGYNDEMSLEGPHAEALDVLGKPYRRSELIDRVQAALRRGARTGPPRRPSDFGHVSA